jgi:hypothetical protein
MVDIEVDPANDNGDLKDATPCELLDGENGGNETHARSGRFDEIMWLNQLPRK